MIEAKLCPWFPKIDTTIFYFPLQNNSCNRIY